MSNDKAIDALDIPLKRDVFYHTLVGRFFCTEETIAVKDDVSGED